MLAFSEERLPARLAFGSTGGVERRTDIVTLASGFERRSTPWANGRRRYLIGAGVRSLDDLSALTAFFEARRGRLQGFRFQDFADHKSCAPAGAPGALDQVIGTGDGTRTTFQLTKTYGSGLDAYAREIRKPAAGSVLVAVAGASLTPDRWSLDTTTGVVTLTTPPTVGAAVTAGFAFDVPVRFDTDRLEITLESFEVGRLVAAPLVEVRV